MTLEEALEFADECGGEWKLYPEDDTQDLREACMLLANEVRRQSAENKTLRSLATCDCGDGFTADCPGMCVNCAVTR